LENIVSVEQKLGKKSKPPMTRKGLYISEALVAKVNALASEHESSFSEVIVTIVAEYFSGE